MNPEKALLKTIEREEDKKSFENLKYFLRQTAERLREEGVPVRPNCRIEMDEFQAVYNIEEIEGDKQEVARIESKISRDGTMSEERLGEQLEMLKTGIFNKFLPSNFVTARASRFDDIKNGVDNVIVDLESGNVVCALDEVGELTGERFEEKKWRILDKNNKGGITLKYALTVEEGKVRPSRALENIPIFYLALPPAYIREGVRSFVPTVDKPPSSYEKKIFEYLISLMDSEIKLIALTPKTDDKLRHRVETFRRVIDRIR